MKKGINKGKTETETKRQRGRDTDTEPLFKQGISSFYSTCTSKEPWIKFYVYY